MDESNHQINFNSLKKSVISLSAVIEALSSSLGPHPESDLITDQYSGSTPTIIKTGPIARWLSLIAQYDEMDSFDFSDLFRSLNTYPISF
jgi:hypothetical protein